MCLGGGGSSAPYTPPAPKIIQAPAAPPEPIPILGTKTKKSNSQNGTTSTASSNRGGRADLVIDLAPGTKGTSGLNIPV